MTVQSIENHCARAWVEIDLGALCRNATALARHAGVPLLPMVKADAYGLGAVAVVRALESLDPLAYGVATVAEGAELRAAGIERPILVFTALLPVEFRAAAAARLTPTFGDPFAIAAWCDANPGAPWHLAIDTGMHRAGVRWDTMDEVAELTRRYPPAGAFTHFHSSELDDGSLEDQERRFLRALESLSARPAMLHTENSGAIVRRSPSPWSFVRPGVFLYGVGSGPTARLQPEPVAQFRARVAEVRTVRAGESVSYDATWRAPRDGRVATLAAGYADGYRRSLGNRGTVLVHGVRCPVVGTVTMDMIMIDVTDIPCAPGDTATLIGRDGDAEVTVEAVADACGLSAYEILTGLRNRVERVYV